jgi:hypothetical protein
MIDAGYFSAARRDKTRSSEPHPASRTYLLGEGNGEGGPSLPAGTGCLSVGAARFSPAAWQVPAARRVPDNPGREELCSISWP